MKASSSPEGRFAKLVEEFFLERLIRQRNSSPQTVAAYRDCFRLLFEFARDQWKKPTESLKLADLDAPLVLAFLDHLEKDRNNSMRSRNARLAAVLWSDSCRAKKCRPWQTRAGWRCGRQSTHSPAR